MTKTDVGGFLAALRKAKGYTQAEAAELLGVSNKTVSNWETGVSSPDISMLPALAELYGVTCDEIARGQRIAPAESERATSAKREKAMARLLEKQRADLFAACCICGGLTVLGIILALAVGCGALESLIGFFVGLIPIAASAVTAAVLVRRIRFAAGGEAESEQQARLLRSANSSLFWLLLADIAAFGFIFPHAFIPVHAGLNLEDALLAGTAAALLFAGAAAVIYAIARAARKNKALQAAVAAGSVPPERAKAMRRRSLLPVWLFALPSTAAILLCPFLFVLAANVTVYIEGDKTNTFDTVQEMEAFAEESELFADFAHELVSEEEPQEGEADRCALVYRFAEAPEDLLAYYDYEEREDGVYVTVYQYRYAADGAAGTKTRELLARNPKLQGGVEQIEADEAWGVCSIRYAPDLQTSAAVHRRSMLRGGLYAGAIGFGCLYLIYLAVSIPLYARKKKQFRREEEEARKDMTA